MIEVRNVDLPILENHRARQVSAADANIGSRICRPDTLRDGTNAVLPGELAALGELDRHAAADWKQQRRLVIETPPIIDIAALGLLALGFALGSGHWALGGS